MLDLVRKRRGEFIRPFFYDGSSFLRRDVSGVGVDAARGGRGWPGVGPGEYALLS